jgi:DNA polymerase III epsilon subunit-like protein
VVSLAKIRKKPKKSINKNINKKSFTQSTPNIAEKLDNEMVAFLDTEFLTSQIKGGPPAKLVSVGFVVCGKNFEEVTRFHSYIYAEDKLHDRFQEMTGIERKDLLSAPDKYVIQRDLLVMCTGEAMAFSTLEEYIQKENAKIGIRNTNSEITQNNI